MNNWSDFQSRLKEQGCLNIKPKNGGYDLFKSGRWKRWYMGLKKPGTIHLINGEAWFGRDEPMLKTQEDFKRVDPNPTWEKFRCHLLLLGYEPIKYKIESPIL